MIRFISSRSWTKDSDNTLLIDSQLNSIGCFRRSKIDPPRRSNFDPLFKLTNLLVYKAHVSLPSPKTLSVHIQDHCVVGNLGAHLSAYLERGGFPSWEGVKNESVFPYIGGSKLSRRKHPPYEPYLSNQAARSSF